MSVRRSAVRPMFDYFRLPLLREVVMLDLDGLAKLQSLHTNGVPESLHLEYKASQAIQNSDARNEVSKDISAVANADGGQLIYGMTENKNNHLPNGLDGGIDPKPYDGLWLEQVIQQNVSPKIEGLIILAVPKGDGKNYFVVSVPKSITVHQAKDGRYYRRRNFRNDIMDD
jgi:predicted HTH transcriptional regulator